MHSTLTTSASALSFLSLISSIRAGLLPALQLRAALTCVNDDYLIAIQTAVPAFDATPFCSSFIGISDTTSYYSTVTPRTTVGGTTSIIATTTEIDTFYDATVTVVATSVDILPKKKRDAAPAPTKRATLDDILPAVAPRADPSVVDSIISGLSSACSCLRLTPGVVFEITTLNTTATRTEDAIVYDTNTVTQTTDGGTTTITITALTTEHLSTILTDTTTTISASPTLTIPSGTASSTTWSNPTDTSSSTTWSNPNSTATTTTASPTASVCPGTNGTRISSSETCKQYVAECFIDYPVTNQMYDLASEEDTPADCAAMCDNANQQPDTPCAGFVFETPKKGQLNCYGLADLDGPIASPPTSNIVTYVIANSTDPSCLANTTSSMPTTSSTISSNWSTTVTSMSTTASGTPSMSVNNTMSRLVNTTHHSHHHHNKTSSVSAMPTNSINSTTTASWFPTNSANSTSSCPAQATVTLNNTITLLQTISVTFTEVETSFLPRETNSRWVHNSPK